MELLFLYIGGREKSEKVEFSHLDDSPFKVLQNAQLNFSNQYKVTYKATEQELLLEERPEFVDNFFDETGKIGSVTGIIGKNGTGKSSILDLIMSLRKDNLRSHFYKLIAVFSYTQEINPFESIKGIKIYYHPELIFTPSTEVPSFKSLFNTDSKISIKNFDEYANFFPSPMVVYYSPVFEVKKTAIKDSFEVYGDQGFENISTTYLIEADTERQTNVPANKFSAEEVLRRHKLMETDRQVQFLYNVKNSSDFLDFQPPRILELTVDNFDEQALTRNDKDAYSMLIQAFDDYSKKNTSTSSKQFLFQLHRAAFFNTLRYFLQNPIDFENLGKILDRELKRDVDPANIRSFIKYLGKGFEDQLQRKGVVPENSISTRLYLLHDFLEAFGTLSDAYFSKYNSDDVKAYILLDEQNEYNLLKKYFDSVSLTGFLVTDWRFSRFSTGEMSSGEKGLISLFSRFYSVYSNARIFDRQNKSMLILIDEGDQLFHPEWQRKFLCRLLKFLVEIFDFAESIQIILTTHSPFIASDLPSFSIIKLNKINGFTRVETVNSDQSTFAANIHELFTDNFYLENGLVGEFAISKVKSLFKKIATSRDSYSLLEREISLIGEPFIKYSLEEKMKDKKGGQDE